MTEEQLEMKMAQIEEDYASLLTDNVVDVTPEEPKALSPSLPKESESSSDHQK